MSISAFLHRIQIILTGAHIILNWHSQNWSQIPKVQYSAAPSPMLSEDEHDDFLCTTSNIPIYAFQIASYSSLSTVGWT